MHYGYWRDRGRKRGGGGGGEGGGGVGEVGGQEVGGRKPYCGFADKVNIRVIVINSLMKYEHEEMDYLIIDESETTFGNLGMDGTDKQIWDRLVTLYSV